MTDQPGKAAPQGARIRWATEVVAALTKLDQREEAFLRCKYFDGTDQATIAETSGVPLADVSRIIAGGMQRLGRALLDTPRPSVPHRPGFEPGAEHHLGVA